MSALPDILARIVADRRAALALEARLGDEAEPAPTRGFLAALQAAAAPRIIAECKRASPSAGVLRLGEPWSPAGLARAYEAAGATCLSVLTEPRHFWGSLADLVEAREACALPVLRKDFLVEPAQVREARRAGADAVLLIAAVLPGEQLGELHAAATEEGLDALVEVVDEEEARRAVDLRAPLVGINHRDLRTFEIDLGRSERLAPALVAAGCFVVAESGLSDLATLERLQAAGASGFLVGTSLLRQADPGAALRRLRGEAA
ncbi:MAG: indole-3-glycerol phosphate synthase TrpC [Deltaproteobacteria bacterium]|nr:indole-3-glycerol phosphate synthase TrpC [Deltaproteobacteria bacterium]